MQAQSSQVLEAINHVHQLARSGRLRSAMEEAFQAITYAPTYLPLHTLIGDLLVRENHTQEAIVKFSAVAQAYSVRGEAAQSAKMLRRVVQLAPMDMVARTKLIDQLVARGRWKRPFAKYLELAEVYYRLAELDNRAQNLYQPPYVLSSRQMLTVVGIFTSFSAWQILICRNWIGSRPFAFMNRSVHCVPMMRACART